MNKTTLEGWTMVESKPRGRAPIDFGSIIAQAAKEGLYAFTAKAYKDAGSKSKVLAAALQAGVEVQANYFEQSKDGKIAYRLVVTA